MLGGWLGGGGSYSGRGPRCCWRRARPGTTAAPRPRRPRRRRPAPPCTRPGSAATPSPSAWPPATRASDSRHALDPPRPRAAGRRRRWAACPTTRSTCVWEVATDDRFTAVVAQGVATAEPDHGHAVHVDADGLDPATDYYYRFTRRRAHQPGRPHPHPARRGLAATASASPSPTASGSRPAPTPPTATCSTRTSTSSLHLGDYIYEYAGGTGRRRVRARPRARDRSPTTGSATRPTSSTPTCRPPTPASRSCVTWDDHEVANNYMGDTRPGGPRPASAGRDRKAAAYQALVGAPARRGSTRPDGYRRSRLPATSTVGDLARLYLLDERQDSDVAAVPGRRRRRRLRRLRRPAPTRTAPASAPTRRRGSPRPSPRAARPGTCRQPGRARRRRRRHRRRSAYYLDTWDGFPDARRRFIDAARRHRQPGRAHRRLPRRHGARRARAPFEPDSRRSSRRSSWPRRSRSPLFPARRQPPAPRSSASRSTPHGYLTVAVEPDGSPPRSGCSTTSTTPAAPSAPPRPGRSTPATRRLVRCEPLRAEQPARGWLGVDPASRRGL